MLEPGLEHIARVTHELLGDRYMFYRRRWFEFDGMKWTYSACGPRNELSTTVVGHFEAIRNDLNSASIDMIVARLKHAAFKDHIAGMCQALFVFTGRLDPHAERYICFSDGVLDAATGELLPCGDPAWRTTIWFDCPHDRERLPEFVAAAVEASKTDVRECPQWRSKQSK